MAVNITEEPRLEENHRRKRSNDRRPSTAEKDARRFQQEMRLAIPYLDAMDSQRIQPDPRMIGTWYSWAPSSILSADIERLLQYQRQLDAWFDRCFTRAKAGDRDTAVFLVKFDFGTYFELLGEPFRRGITGLARKWKNRCGEEETNIQVFEKHILGFAFEVWDEMVKKRKLDAPFSIESLGGCLITAVKNRLIDECRKRRAKTRGGERTHYSLDTPHISLVSPSLSPLFHLAATEELNEREMRIVELRYHDPNITNTDVARELGMTEGNVRHLRGKIKGKSKCLSSG